MLSPYGKREWLTIIAVSLMLSLALVLFGLWWASIVVMLAMIALLTFFRDPRRLVPTQRNVMVSPADGRVSSVHELEHFEPLGEPATCIRIFLSVLNVHVNRSPCHGIVSAVTHKAGQKLNALNPKSAEVNESTQVVLLHPIRKKPIAAVRQIAGILARTIVADVQEGQILQRGQRYGMIKFGSTTELYIPQSLNPQVTVQQGQRVVGGVTVLAQISAVGDEVKAPTVAPAQVTSA